MEKDILNLKFDSIFKKTFNLKKFFKDEYLSNCAGIYFLFEKDIIVYIGISQNISERIFGSRGHILNKEFEKYSFIEINKENYILEKLEFVLINFFDPILNLSNRKQKFINKLPADYRSKIENYELFIARKNALLMSKFFDYV